MKTELHFTIIKKENQSTLIQVFNKTPLKFQKRRHAVVIHLNRDLMSLHESLPRCPVNVINLLLQELYYKIHLAGGV